MEKKVYSKEQKDSYKKLQEGFKKRPSAGEELGKVWDRFVGKNDEAEEKPARFKKLESSIKNR
jgi:hypothetical protein